MTKEPQDAAAKEAERIIELFRQSCESRYEGMALPSKWIILTQAKACAAICVTEIINSWKGRGHYATHWNKVLEQIQKP